MKKIDKEEMLNKELEKLVNMSRMLTKEKITTKLIDIIKIYDVANILHKYENGLLVIMEVDY